MSICFVEVKFYCLCLSGWLPITVCGLAFVLPALASRRSAAEPNLLSAGKMTPLAAVIGWLRHTVLVPHVANRNWSSSRFAIWAGHVPNFKVFTLTRITFPFIFYIFKVVFGNACNCKNLCTVSANTRSHCRKHTLANFRSLIWKVSRAISAFII